MPKVDAHRWDNNLDFLGMILYRMKLFYAATYIVTVVLFGTNGCRTATFENRSMASEILIEWSKLQSSAIESTSAEIIVFDDGRVSLSERLGGGEHQLTTEQLDELRTYIFEEQQLTKINEQDINREVEVAIATKTSEASPKATFVSQSQVHSGTTLIRSNLGGNEHIVRHGDLVGNAQAFPDIENLQRLRLIELKLLELAKTLTLIQ